MTTIHRSSWASTRRGPLTSKRMETVDEEIHGHATRFIEEAVGQLLGLLDRLGIADDTIVVSQGGELNAIRWNDWKVHVAVQRGNIRWYGEQMWLFIPVQQKLQEFFKGFLAEAQRRLGKLEELPLAPRN